MKKLTDFVCDLCHAETVTCCACGRSVYFSVKILHGKPVIMLIIRKKTDWRDQKAVCAEGSGYGVVTGVSTAGLGLDTVTGASLSRCRLLGFNLGLQEAC